MNSDMGYSYKDAGVDKEAGKRALESVSDLIRSTHDAGVLGGLEHFGGMYELKASSSGSTVLVAGADGVGTKLKVAGRAERHDTIGIDLVAMCVNDILAQGAKPLFFLDYLACSSINETLMEEIFSGIVRGCKKAECALLGGETAQMPGYYSEGEYELAGFAVGQAKKKNILPREEVKSSHTLVGLASSGLHSNGFSLVRKLIFHEHDYNVEDYIPELGRTLAEELLIPTRIYVRPVMSLLNESDCNILAIAHITGGGLPENVARILPEGSRAIIRKNTWPIKEVFEFIQELGEVSSGEMFKTFNMGIGMVLAVPDEQAEKVVERLQELGETARVIGHVEAAEKEVRIV